MNSSFKKVLVVGGSGFVGSLLINKLLSERYNVISYDLEVFGQNYSQSALLNKNFAFVKADIRNQSLFSMAVQSVDAVIYLACISNDPSYDYNVELSHSINFKCFESCVKAAKNAGVKRFIFASSSSVYGPSDEEADVTEDHPVNPITSYSRDKHYCEKIMLNYHCKDFEAVIVRPATLFGISNRIRFDLVVNILTANGVLNKEIIVHGGKQLRPNLHVQDMVDFYSCILNSSPSLVGGQAFNIGLENHTVLNLAALVRKAIANQLLFDPEIQTIPINDTRSYKINSDKAFIKLGFKPKLTITDGIESMIDYIRKSKLSSVEDTLNYSNLELVKRFQFM